jgi:hypothetical protein
MEKFVNVLKLFTRFHQDPELSNLEFAESDRLAAETVGRS